MELLNYIVIFLISAAAVVNLSGVLFVFMVTWLYAMRTGVENRRKLHAGSVLDPWNHPSKDSSNLPGRLV